MWTGEEALTLNRTFLANISTYTPLSHLVPTGIFWLITSWNTKCKKPTYIYGQKSIHCFQWVKIRFGDPENVHLFAVYFGANWLKIIFHVIGWDFSSSLLDSSYGWVLLLALWWSLLFFLIVYIAYEGFLKLILDLALVLTLHRTFLAKISSHLPHLTKRVVYCTNNFTNLFLQHQM